MAATTIEKAVISADGEKLMMRFSFAAQKIVDAATTISFTDNNDDDTMRIQDSANGFSALSGVVGSSIKPYIIEIVDQDKMIKGDSVSVSSTDGLPTGLSVVKMSLNSPLEIFAITGTPSGSGSDQLTINFTDGDATITAVIDYNIQG